MSDCIKEFNAGDPIYIDDFAYLAFDGGFFENGKFYYFDYNYELLHPFDNPIIKRQFNEYGELKYYITEKYDETMKHEFNFHLLKIINYEAYKIMMRKAFI